MKVGDIISGYVITKQIGSGGMGDVFLVQKNESDYALKTCRDKDAESLKRFQREYRIMEKFKGNFSIHVYDADFNVTEPFFVMEKCDCSLVDYRNKLKGNAKLEKLIEVCKGVAELHAQGIIHRDIKAQNILVKNGQIKITDFGLGRLIKRDSTTITGSGVVMGTPGYIAPEIYINGDSKNADERSDIYSLGGLIFNVLSGIDPQFVSPSVIAADVYPVISKCRAANPLARYQNVRQLVDALVTVLKIRTGYVDMSTLIANVTKMSSQEFLQKVLAIFIQTNSLREFLSNYHTLGSVSFENLVTHDASVANQLALKFIQLSNDKSANDEWLNFEDIDPLCHICCLLYKAVNDSTSKIELSHIGISCSVNYNRWHAEQEVFNRIISNWDTKSIIPFINVIKGNRDLLEGMEKSIGVKMPSIVTQYY